MAQKYSIAISSGGMKGVFTLGALHGLRDAKDQVTEIACSSSGALNAAYFLAGQTEQAREVYKVLSNADFIEMKNLPPRMKIEEVWKYAFDKDSQYQLDLDAVINSSIELKMPLLNIDTGSEEVFTNRTSKEQLTEVLKASIAVPVWYGKAVRIGEHNYIDGAVTNPFPLHLVDGQDTTIIGISTKQRPFLYTPNKQLMAAYAEHQYDADPDEAKLIQAKKMGSVNRARAVASKSRTHLITPQKPFHQLTSDRSVLESAFLDGVGQGENLKSIAALVLK